MTDTERLPQLIEQAATMLAKATTAAEVLDVRDRARFAYDDAKRAARLADIKGAHATVKSACRKVQADALAIESLAQCRLADEVDAAQDRGELAKSGQQDRVRDSVPNGNAIATAAEIGLTRKEIHEARAVRDAEKQNPGVIRQSLDDKLNAGGEPTRADVKRVVQNMTGKRKGKTRAEVAPQAVEREQRVERLMALGKSSQEIADELGVGLRATNQAMEHVKIRQEAEAQIDPATLSLSAQEKLASAIRQHQRTLDAEFDKRLQQRLQDMLADTVLPAYNKSYAEYQDVIQARKGVMDRATFNRIRRCLHPDSRNSVSDEKLREAFNLFAGLELRLLDESQHPTATFDMPRTYEELMARKRAVQEKRRARRDQSNDLAQKLHG